MQRSRPDSVSQGRSSSVRCPNILPTAPAPPGSGLEPGLGMPVPGRVRAGSPSPLPRKLPNFPEPPSLPAGSPRTGLRCPAPPGRPYLGQRAARGAAGSSSRGCRRRSAAPWPGRGRCAARGAGTAAPPHPQSAGPGRRGGAGRDGGRGGLPASPRGRGAALGTGQSRAVLLLRAPLLPGAAGGAAHLQQLQHLQEILHLQLLLHLQQILQLLHLQQFQHLLQLLQLLQLQPLGSCRCEGRNPVGAREKGRLGPGGVLSTPLVSLKLSLAVREDLTWDLSSEI